LQVDLTCASPDVPSATLITDALHRIDGVLVRKFADRTFCQLGRINCRD